METKMCGKIWRSKTEGWIISVWVSRRGEEITGHSPGLSFFFSFCPTLYPSSQWLFLFPSWWVCQEAQQDDFHLSAIFLRTPFSLIILASVIPLVLVFWYWISSLFLSYPFLFSVISLWSISSTVTFMARNMECGRYCMGKYAMKNIQETTLRWENIYHAYLRFKVHLLCKCHLEHLLY